MLSEPGAPIHEDDMPGATKGAIEDLEGGQGKLAQPPSEAAYQEKKQVEGAAVAATTVPVEESEEAESTRYRELGY
jgi:hypothetical protein